ncbi:MAG: helix-turn-helix transcriptional regulator [Acidobacteria bacterium]|nr:helix-turn-helix transcriptional regulator [Acidobacteriota bacterium]
MKEGKKPYYMISAVAKLYNIHPQTLRLYEREGLLKPSRTEGNTRLYSDEDLKKLELILNLTRELGVNLAGVEVILNMREKLEKLQREYDELVKFVCETLKVELRSVEDLYKNALVKVPRATIARFKEMRENGDKETGT